MRDPSGRQRPDRPMGPQPPTNRSRFPTWIIWVVLGAFALYYVYVLFWPHTTARLNVPYSSFVTQVQANNVKSVTIEGQSVTGAFNQEMQLAGTQLLPASQPAPSGGFGQ